MPFPSPTALCLWLYTLWPFLQHTMKVSLGEAIRYQKRLKIGPCKTVSDFIHRKWTTILTSSITAFQTTHIMLVTTTTYLLTQQSCLFWVFCSCTYLSFLVTGKAWYASLQYWHFFLSSTRETMLYRRKSLLRCNHHFQDRASASCYSIFKQCKTLHPCQT